MGAVYIRMQDSWVTQSRKNARTSSQVSDLSLHGCFVEMVNPFPYGTNVLIEIYTETEFLETHATVARFEPKQGMGLTFDEIPPHFASVLSKWLRQGEKPTEFTASARPHP